MQKASLALRGAMATEEGEANVLLANSGDGPWSRIATAQSTQMCGAAGQPVLMGARGKATPLVEEAGAGLAYVPESASNLAEAVGRLCAMLPVERRGLGHRGRRFYAERPSFSRGVESLLRVYGAMMGGAAE